MAATSGVLVQGTVVQLLEQQLAVSAYSDSPCLAVSAVSDSPCLEKLEKG